MTGLWEKQLKEIEKGNYNAGSFINNMKKMVDQLVYEVRSEQTRANISSTTSISKVNIVKKKSVKSKTTDLSKASCPKCNQGTIIKGSSAFGCSTYKNGCTFRIPFSFMQKKISDKQLIRLITKGATVNLKGFKTENGTIDGFLNFDDDFNIKLKEKQVKATTPDVLTCPKCKIGTILKGKTAYGCSNYVNGCGFKFLFETIKQQAGNKPLTKELVYHILNGNK